MTSFVSVATSAARYQDISLNPQKLAGQCAKLKCCLNFEVDAYVESVKRLPSKEIRLETADATYYHFKTDIFKREMTYSTDKSVPANLITLDAERVFEIIAMNKAGEKPLKLQRDGEEKEVQVSEFGDIIGQDGITRFDNKKKKKKRKKDKPDNPNRANNDGNNEHKGENKPKERNEPKGENKPKERNEPRINNLGNNRNRDRRNRDRQRQPKPNNGENNSNTDNA